MRGAAKRHCLPMLSLVVFVVLIPSPARAAQTYFVQTPGPMGGFPAATHDGELTFFPNRKDTFKVEPMVLTDILEDSAGVNARFKVVNVNGGTGETRTFYHGGGVGTARYFTEEFTRPSNVKNVRAIVCSTDDGDEYGCIVDPDPMDNPHT